MPHIGLPELLVILFLALVIFGAGKLSGVGHALGQSICEFKEANQARALAEGENRPAAEEEKEVQNR